MHTAPIKDRPVLCKTCWDGDGRCALAWLLKQKLQGQRYWLTPAVITQTTHTWQGQYCLNCSNLQIWTHSKYTGTSHGHASNPTPNLDHETLPISILYDTMISSDDSRDEWWHWQTTSSDVRSDCWDLGACLPRFPWPFINKDLIIIEDIYKHWPLVTVFSAWVSKTLQIWGQTWWGLDNIFNLHPMITKTGEGINTHS